MTPELPTEIIDLVVEALPYDFLLWSIGPLPEHHTARKHQKRDLCSFSSVSRSFNEAARRRLFSTIVIRNPCPPGTKAKWVHKRLQDLHILLQDEDFLTVVRTVKIEVGNGDTPWHVPHTVDAVIGRILSEFDHPCTNLMHLAIEGPIRSSVAFQIGQSTNQALLKIIPRVEILSFKSFRPSPLFFESAKNLQTLTLIHAQFGRNVVALEVLPAHQRIQLPPYLSELILRFDLWDLNAFLSAHNCILPVCAKLRIEYRKKEVDLVDALLTQCRTTLQSLVLVRQFCYDTVLPEHMFSYTEVEFPDFQVLKTLKFVLDGTKNSQLEGLLNFVHQAILTILNYLDSSHLPQSLEHLEFLVPYIGDVYMHKEIEAVMALTQSPPSCKLAFLDRLPNLKSIRIVVDFPGELYFLGHAESKDEGARKMGVNIEGVLQTIFSFHGQSRVRSILHIYVTRELPSELDIYRAERFASQ